MGSAVYIQVKQQEYNQQLMLKFIALISIIALAASQTSNCSLYCVKCDNEVCLSCTNFYYLENNTCFHCSTKCTSCISASNCTSCVYGYYSLNGSCTTCSNGCISCLNQTNCISCGNLFYRQNATCHQCPKECATCDSTGCFSCVYGYHLVNTTCTPCNGSCSSCSYLVGCPNCLIGEYILNNVCKPCLKFCAVCPNNSTCTTCINDYFLQDETCNWCGLCPNQTTCKSTGICSTAAMVSSAAPEKSTGSLIAIYILVPIAFLVFVLACCLITIYKKSGAASSGSKQPILSETVQTISTQKNFTSGSRLSSNSEQLSINNHLDHHVDVKAIIPPFKEDEQEENVDTVTR